MSITRALWLIAVLLLVGCGGPQAPRLLVSEASNGLRVRTEPPMALQELQLVGGDGVVLQRWRDLPAQADGWLLTVAGNREGPSAERLVAFVSGGPRLESEVARTGEQPPVAVRMGGFGSTPIKLPFETGGEVVLALSPGAQLLLEAELVVDTPGDLHLRFGPSLASKRHTWPVFPDDRWEVRLTPATPRATKLVDVDLSHQRLNGTVWVKFSPQDGEPSTWFLETRVEEVPADFAAGHLRVEAIQFPAPRPGAPPQPNSGIINIPNPTWNRVASWLGLPQQHLRRGVPVDDLLVAVSSSYPRELPLAVRASVYPAGEDEPAPAFAPEGWRAGSSQPQVSRLVNLRKGTTEIRLPVYARPGVAPGEYELQVSGAVLGSDEDAFARTETIRVQASSSTISAALLGTCVLSALTVLTLGLGYKRLMAAATPRELMLIALIAALWVGGGLALRLMNISLSVLLGPFNVFIGELATEIWTYVCLMVLLVLRPRPGTFALAYSTHFLLAGLLAGELQPVGLLIAGSTIGLTEALCYLTGLTSGARLLDRYPRAPVLVGLVAAVALGVADAVATYVQLAIAVGFYRIMYAPWYVAAMVGVTGFGYTAIGVLMGLPLAVELRKIDA
ncbi:MAG TPA: hypothetical protein VEI97_10855 [bacterium]|nr:hypothetical protein [bacterium]